MAFYKEYRGFEVHLEEVAQDYTNSQHKCVSWKVLGFGTERSNGVAASRQDAYYTACTSIDQIEDKPLRFPVNLVGYPEQSDGDVITRDGEVLGRWRISENEALEIIEFIPLDTKDVLFKEHFLGVLCSRIREWHEEG